jgi:hypothetical protein
MSFPAGETIVQKGAVPTAFFIVVEGEPLVRATDDKPEQRLLPGDDFGAVSVLTEAVWRRSIVAVRACKVLAVTKENFQWVWALIPGYLAESFMRSHREGSSLEQVRKFGPTKVALEKFATERHASENTDCLNDIEAFRANFDPLKPAENRAKAVALAKHYAGASATINVRGPIVTEFTAQLEDEHTDIPRNVFDKVFDEIFVVSNNSILPDFKRSSGFTEILSQMRPSSGV